MNLQEEVDALTARWYRQRLNDVTVAMIRNDVQQLIYRFYDCGGYVLDRRGEPIWDRTNVGIAIDANYQNGSVGIATYRRNNAGQVA